MPRLFCFLMNKWAIAAPLFFILSAIGSVAAHAQTATPFPTITPTPAPTPVITATATITATTTTQVIQLPSGSSGQIVYSITTGDIGIIILLSIIITMMVFWIVRDNVRQLTIHNDTNK